MPEWHKLASFKIFPIGEVEDSVIFGCDVASLRNRFSTFRDHEEEVITLPGKVGNRRRIYMHTAVDSETRNFLFVFVIEAKQLGSR